MNKAILADYLDSLQNCGIPGCDCVIYLNREPIFRHISGYSDSGKTKPLTKDNTYWLYSATKIITCTAVMQLAEKGNISIDDEVSEYLPEYKNLKVKNGDAVERAKNAMTIRHLLTMQSGLNYNFESPSILKVIRDTRGQATTRQIVAALANEPLDFEPGTHFLYSLSHDVLAAVIEEVSGQKFGAYLDDNIFKPLGMKNTGFELTPELKSNMADQFEFHMDTMSSVPIPSNNRFSSLKNYESGGGGLISTADDYIKFLDAMCNDGISAGGYRIISRESIDQMRKDQLHDISRKDFEVSFKRIGYSYGLGVRTLIEKEKSGAGSPLGEFGWDGAAGAYALIDVQNNLALFYVQHVRNCGYAYHVVHPKIRDLAYEMIGFGNNK